MVSSADGANVQPRGDRSVLCGCDCGTNSGLVSQKMIDRAKLLTRENSTRTNGSANSRLVSQKVIDRAELLTGECGVGDCGRRDLLRRRCLGAVDDRGYCGNTDRRDSEQSQEQNPSLWLVRSDCRTASVPVCGCHDCLPASCGRMTSRRILDRAGCRGVASGLHPRCMLVRGWLEVDSNEAPAQACNPVAAAGEHSLCQEASRSEFHRWCRSPS